MTKSATKQRDPDKLQVVYRPIEQLIPYSNNPRTHSADQIAQIIASIQEFGWTNPILTDGESGVIAGHGRLQAAMALNLNQVPTIELSGLTTAQKQAYIIADNKLAENAGWDWEILGTELQSLADQDYDLDILGFSEIELAELLADEAEGLTDPDDVPPVQEVAVSQAGDTWKLGDHRLVCGDCTRAEDVAKCLNGVEPHLLITDPPYGVRYDASWRQKATGSTGGAMGKVLNDDICDWREAWGLAPCTVAYIWHAGTKSAEVAASLASCGFKIRAQIVWIKQRHVLSRGDYHSQHEPLYYAVKDGEDESWNFIPEHELAAYAVKCGEVGHYHGGRKQSTVWFIEHLKSETGHSTQKPVACMLRPIINNSSRGQAVYEPFSGSGTTIIAAQLSGRSCHAIELNPLYVDMAIRRWQNFTGKQAILETDGRTFAKVESDGH